MSCSYHQDISQLVRAIEARPDDHTDKKVRMLLKELDTVRVTNQRVSHTCVHVGRCVCRRLCRPGVQLLVCVHFSFKINWSSKRQSCRGKRWRRSCKLRARKPETGRDPQVGGEDTLLEVEGPGPLGWNSLNSHRSCNGCSFFLFQSFSHFRGDAGSTERKRAGCNVTPPAGQWGERWGCMPSPTTATGF